MLGKLTEGAAAPAGAGEHKAETGVSAIVLPAKIFPQNSIRRKIWQNRIKTFEKHLLSVIIICEFRTKREKIVFFDFLWHFCI